MLKNALCCLIVGMFLLPGCDDAPGNGPEASDPNADANARVATPPAAAEAPPPASTGNAEAQLTAAPGAPDDAGGVNADTNTDWPQFRGPGGLAISGDADLPVQWSTTDNIAWKTPLPGAGTSSPIVFNGRIYLTAHTGYAESTKDIGDMDDLKRHVLCLDRETGRVLWDKTVPTVLPEQEYSSRMHWHGYASNTPAADASGVYVFFGKSGVFKFDHDGKQLWQASVGSNTHGWGSAASPVLHGELVIINAYSESGDLVALNKDTGDEVWRVSGVLKEVWNTPILVEAPGGGRELVIGNWGQVLGYDPASGEKLWECRGLDWYIVGSLVAHDGVVYCISGRKDQAVAVRVGGRGDVTDTHLVWRADKGSNVSSPIAHAGYVYFAHETNGIAYCLDAKTGEVMYESRLPNRPGHIYASPVIGDGKLYYITRDGTAYVLATGPQFNVLATNTMNDGGAFNACPAIDDGQLLIRSDRFLYCVGAK